MQSKRSELDEKHQKKHQDKRWFKTQKRRGRPQWIVG